MLSSASAEDLETLTLVDLTTWTGLHKKARIRVSYIYRNRVNEIAPLARCSAKLFNGCLPPNAPCFLL
jgi:hypothetical protein